MENWQTIIIVAFGLYAALCFVLGLRNTHFKKNPYGLTPWLNPIGAFVWADAVIFGLFFFLTSAASLILQDFILFLLIYSVFWVVRSVGEQIYWFHEQFTEKHKNSEKTLWISRFFPKNSAWIAMQISWQCVSVVAIIFTVFLFTKWL